MLESLINATPIQKGLFLMAAGIAGVFAVLIIFYVLIKVLQRVFPEKG